MRRSPATQLRRATIVLLAVLVLAEALPRLLGLTDFPIYQTDRTLGYIPAPNQSGRFLNKNAWNFNDRSMPIATSWNPSLAPNLLLLGNSIVQGGNPIDQKDRLGTFLQDDIWPQFQVWPIAVGGWSNVNEVMYLQRYPDVAEAADFLVWEYMAGGLSELSQSRGELLTPTHHAWFASWFVLRRYILPRYFNFGDNELPPTGTPNAANVAMLDEMIGRLAAQSKRTVHGIIFLYPEASKLTLARAGSEWLPERAEIAKIAEKHHLMVLDVAQQPAWNASLYRDPVHPNARGNQVLAQILSDTIRKATTTNADPNQPVALSGRP